MSGQSGADFPVSRSGGRKRFGNYSRPEQKPRFFHAGDNGCLVPRSVVWQRM